MKIIQTALCSFGMSGKVFHAPFLQLHKGFNLYGVWERSAQSAKEFYPHIKSFSSLDAMLQDPQIDLVIVNTPNYTHYEFAKKALEAGKDVLVEKAFTVTVSEARELLELAQTKGRKITVYQNRRYDSDFKTVQKIVRDGSLGKIVEASIYFDRYNLTLSPKQHKETTNPGAGLLHDLGPHIIDQALQLFGMPHSLFGVLRVQRPLSLVNDYFDAQLFYTGLTVRVKASLIAKEPPAAYTLHGMQGSFVKQRADVQEEMLKRGKLPEGNDWGREPETAAGILNIMNHGHTERTVVPSLQGNYMDFFNQLYNGLVNDQPLPVSPEEAFNCIRIIEAIRQSHLSKSLIKL